ncbi:MAG: HupE/UreJ family protein [Gammaproteobacteria bacterium]|nr:HupE/UreJ family protein [Gammaproteobacteria bacterium]MBU2287955.1 HupE/UreJ family protein [Gammaproteobacteria bacterium]MBU2410960.1 HupE/UreJ family protein [Gammaproteobacteria bacterium]
MAPARAWRAVLLSLWALLFVALPAQAHKASDAYLLMNRTGDTVLVRWDISLRDLDAVLDLDANDDRKLTWGEIKSRMNEIRTYALSRLRLDDGRCALSESEPPAVDTRIDGAYLVLRLQAPCASDAALKIDYQLFSEVDPTHRGLLRMVSAEGATPVIRSLDPAAGAVRVEWAGPDAQASTDASGISFFRDGVHHILIGYDHVLFLICLLLPAVLRRREGRWEPVAGWRDAVWPMVGMVTMFTLAHSITLALAGLKIVTISPRIIEPAIAVTIIVAALDNLHPVLRGRRKLFSFFFGLIHGFGFAGVLGELNLPVAGFVKALLLFNLGVEAGQLVIVSIALLVLVTLRHWQGYINVVLRSGSVVAVMVAGTWFVERVFDLKFLPV